MTIKVKGGRLPIEKKTYLRCNIPPIDEVLQTKITFISYVTYKSKKLVCLEAKIKDTRGNKYLLSVECKTPYGNKIPQVERERMGDEIKSKYIELKKKIRAI